MRDLLSIIILANALVIFLNLFSLQLAQAAATFTIVNLDGAGEGFNEATPAAPVGGNTGITPRPTTPQCVSACREHLGRAN